MKNRNLSFEYNEKFKKYISLEAFTKKLSTMSGPATK